MDNRLDHAEKQVGKFFESDKDYLFLCVQDKIDHNLPGAAEVKDFIRESFYEVSYPEISPFEKSHEDYKVSITDYKISETNIYKSYHEYHILAIIFVIFACRLMYTRLSKY